MQSQNTKNRTFIKLLAVEPNQYSVTKEPLLILVKTEEYYNNYNSSVYSAEIRITHRVLKPERFIGHSIQQFCASYGQTSSGGEVVLTAPMGGGRSVFLDPPAIRGSRVGTYLMNILVQWAKQWPDADISSIHLLENQAGNSADFHTERRNRFYEQFNIEFSYTDPETKESGFSKPMKALSLTEVDTWKDYITEHEVHDYLVSMHKELDSAARALTDCSRVKDNWAERYKRAEKNPFRWFARALFNKFAPILGFLFFLGLVAGVGYQVILEIRQWLL